MPEQPIPFVNQQSSGHEELGGASPVAMNVIVDATGTVIRRPGIVAYSGDGSAAVSGIYVTNSDRVIVVYETPGEREIADSTDPLAEVTLARPDGTAMGLSGTARPVFAETEALLVIAGGADMQKVVLGPPETTDRLGGSPPLATHVTATQSRLEANDTAPTSSSTVIRFSGIAQGTITYAGLEQWSLGIGGAGFITAEANPDPVVAVASNSNELWAFGSRTLQIFGGDPSFVFAPVSAIELGMGAPYSAVPYDQQFNWLDSRRRFVTSDGRQYDVISDPIKRTLDAMSRVDDCWGTRLVMGPLEALVWTFPTEGRVFAIQKGGGWAQWQGWDGNNWTPWPVTSCAYRASSGTFLVGLSDGSIGTLSLDANTDLGNPIRAYVRTGYQNRGTDALKECLCVRFTLRRGQTSAAEGPQAFFWWSDFPGQTMPKIPIDLGASGDFEVVIQFHGLGVYRRRQWHFEFAGPEQLTLVSASESFNVLEAY